MPTNLYGPDDNFDLNTSHVVPALLRKFHEAAESGTAPTLWGTGRARREFLHVDDCAEACVFLMNEYSDSQPINVGAGNDITIAELALLMAGVTGYKGEVKWDDSMPDGTPRKLLDSSRINTLGWQPKISLREGLEMTHEWYKNKDHTVSICYEKH
jgi:GDP-L-fucose synthase